MNQFANISSNPTAQNPQDSIREAFRQCLRQADKYILEGNFEQAKIQIDEAKKLDRGNPFIIAFEERINLFEKKGDIPQIKIPSSTPQKTPTVKKTSEAEQPSRDVLEQKLRQQIEHEYKNRFTQELRKAEERAAKILEEEKLKLEHQGQVWKQKFEHQLSESRKQLEQEYQHKLDEEIAKAEERLEQQHHAELAFIENEMKTQLTQQYEGELSALRKRMEDEKSQLLEEERQAFINREKILNEQFNTKLLESLRKAESVFQQQSLQQQQLEREKIERELKEEFKTILENERKSLKEQFETLKKSTEESFQARSQELQSQNEQKVIEQINALRHTEEEKFEEKRTALRTELEAEFQKKYEDQITAEKHRLQQDVELAVDKERKRLGEEYNQLIQKQNDQVQKIRTDLRAEMEQTFLTRLERIAREYDHKMELLGVKVPTSKDEKLELYRKKMLSCYQDGQPTVENAKLLMQLKELLELTFDDHLAIESDIRLDLYVQYVERKIRSGELNLQKPDALEKIKQKFNISTFESQRLEPYILSCFQRLATRGRILVVDDDLLLLSSLEEMLHDANFQAVTAPDIRTAMDKLDTTKIDLILSDIKFGVDDLDGFQFFKNVQENSRLRNIPFVFMSALKDGVIVRSGVQLGVDDYITKPMDPELLIATIEGKLKRYRSISHQ